VDEHEVVDGALSSTAPLAPASRRRPRWRRLGRGSRCTRWVWRGPWLRACVPRRRSTQTAGRRRTRPRVPGGPVCGPRRRATTRLRPLGLDPSAHPPASARRHHRHQNGSWQGGEILARRSALASIDQLMAPQRQRRTRASPWISPADRHRELSARLRTSPRLGHSQRLRRRERQQSRDELPDPMAHPNRI